MDILMVSAELAPHVRETDAADSVASLAKALRLLGHSVMIAAPHHPNYEASGLLLARRLTPLPLPGGHEVTVFDGQLASGVGLVLFDAPVLYDRPGVYGEEGEDYPDNAKRFGVLAEAVAALIRQRAQQGRAFDVMHVHDWAGALVPLTLRRSEGPVVPAVLTIHDGTRQGVFPLRDREALGVSEEMAGEDGLLLEGQLNVLKGGILYSDAITTVSPSYARELELPERSGPLAHLIKHCPKELFGIVNGVDYAIYNPATDPLIVSRYDAEDPSNKGRSKSALLRELELEIEVERPLVAAFGRFSMDKGGDVLAATLPGIMKHDVTLIVAGNGPEAIMNKLLAAREHHPHRLGVVSSPNETLLHRLYAAADIVLVPSRHEPSGAVHLIAQRYGAAVVAHATGGAIDTLLDADAELQTGTGFLFDELSSNGLLGGLTRALGAYASPSWGRLRRRIMRQDLGWDRPARRYLQIYRQTLAVVG